MQTDTNPEGHVNRVTVPIDRAGQRFDQCLAGILEGVSRSRIQRWIEAGHVTVSNTPVRARARVRGGEEVIIAAEAAHSGNAELSWAAEPGIALSVLYQDGHVIVIDKPPGLVVHPGAGTPAVTLANRLLAEFRDGDFAADHDDVALYESFGSDAALGIDR